MLKSCSETFLSVSQDIRVRKEYGGRAARGRRACDRNTAERNRMKRRLIIAGVAVAVLIAVIWGVSRGRRIGAATTTPGTVETREIQIGSKIGGRVIACSGRRGPGRQGRGGRWCASNAMS